MNPNIPPAVQPAFERQAHPFHMWDGIQNIPQGIDEILTDPVQHSLDQAAQAIAGRSPVHLVGCGTSYFAAIAATYVFQEIAQVTAVAANAFEFYAYPPPELDQAALVGISHTGGTPAVVRALEIAANRQAVTVGFTDVNGSALGRTAQYVVGGELGVEPALPKTRSYEGALMRGYSLALHLAEHQARGVTDYKAVLGSASRLAGEILRDTEAPVRGLAEKYRTPRRIVVVGGGPELATAMEASLKLTEAALQIADAWELEEAVHGTWASTREEDLIIILAMKGPGFEKCQRLATGMKTIGASVWAITDDDRGIEGADDTTYLPTGAAGLFTPLFSILPLYLFTYFLALANHIPPDNMRLADPRFLQARTLMRESIK